MADPLSIGGCRVWYKADAGVYQDAGSTLCTATGQNVEQWNDQSGNGANASQSSGGSIPTYVLSGIAKELPIIDFGTNGFDYQMSTTLSVGTPFTIACVYLPGTPTLTGFHRAVTGTTNYLIGVRSGYNACYAGGFVTTGSVGPPSSTTAFVRAVHTNSGSASHFLVNNVDITTGGTNVGTPGTLVLGCGTFIEPLGGYLAEVVIYSSVLSSTNLGLLDTYLQRWQNPLGPVPAALLLAM